MVAALLIGLLSAAAPPASDAEALAAKPDAEALFLRFGAVRPDDYEPAQRARVAKALLRGAEAARGDAAIGLQLAERSVMLAETADALAVLAGFEVGLEERASAARHLERALELQPKHLPALVARADLAMREDEFAVAAALYERAATAGAKDVKAKLASARTAAAEKQEAVSNLRRAEQEIRSKVELASRNAARDWLRQIAAEDEEATAKRRLAPDGVRKQEMARFVFTYSAGSRNAGEMLAFENKVERLLNHTWEFVTDRLGYRLEKRTPVVLMTRAEYASTFGGTHLMAAAGFWDGNRIVINGGAEVDERFAEVMVHEFTHALVTDVAGHGNVPRWLNEGLAENMRLCAAGREGKLPDYERMALAGLRKQGGLPRIGDLDAVLESMSPGAEIAYQLSSVAVRVLVDQRGYGEVMELLRELRRNPRAAPAIERRFMSLDRLQQQVDDALG